ncbi:TPA: proteasome assembly chaperone family protein, partial [Candidatus Micrarchaeota archaeon]|nr:proteasome assembly chaperone family protein [Candidatus Micrarchaeota archaeon]
MRAVIHQRDLSAKYLITGLPGIGRVGHVAAAYILNKTENTLVADLYS